MKILPAKVWLVALMALLVVAGIFWIQRVQPTSSDTRALDEPPSVAATGRQMVALSSKVTPPSQVDPPSDAVAASAILASGWKTGAQTEFAAFRAWTQRFQQAAAADRSQLLAVGLGLELAQARRTALAQLIRTDPEAALAAAVPPALRQQLPAEIVALLEEQVTGEGEIALNAVTPLPGEQPDTPVFRSALIGRKEYRAFVYGERARQRSVPKTSIIGIAVDRDLAVADLGRQILLGDHDHAAADNQPGTSGVPDRPNQAWTHGVKKVLIIRVDFSDFPGTPTYPSGGAPITDDYAVNLFNDANGINDFYVNSSYGKTSLLITPTTASDSPDVTNLLRMPQTAASYATAGNNTLLHSDARAAAQADGYVVDNYDRIGVIFTFLGTSVVPGSQITYGGLGNIEGKNFWVNGYYDFRVVGHELGHNYGLFHSNLWKVTDGNPLSPTGTTLEYGDTYDLMGTGNTSINDFSHWNKSLLQWIPDTAVTVAQTAGTFRIYRFDHADANLANPRALKIVRDSAKDYWIGYRRGTTNVSLDGGAYVLWGYNSNQQGNLLDINTPGTDLVDAGLAIGSPLNDTVAGITIQPVAQGGTGAEEYLDVQVSFQPRINWSQADYIASELSGSAVLTLKRTYNSSGSVSVNYTTAPGTATAPADFTTQSGTVTWTDGDTADKTVTITLTADAVAEGTETFTVNLSGITGGVLGDISTATVSLIEPGRRDPVFDADFINSTVKRVLPLPDGSFVLGGSFTQLQAANFTVYDRSAVTRLLANGTIDPDFASEGGAGGVPVLSSAVYDLARQPDGRILAAGDFTTFNGTARNRIVRLMPDGSVDSSFNPGTGADSIVYAVLVQPDGKIVIGGAFTNFNGTPREYLARLNADGSLDTGFVGPDFGNNISWRVESLAVQPDGKLLVGGSFYFTGPNFKAGICRVTTTGALDAAFNGVVEGAHEVGNTGSLQAVRRIVVQPDGQILITGYFTAFNNTARGGIARLTSTGALDAGFAPMPNIDGNFGESCCALLLQPDGKILVGGDFTSISSVTATRIALLSSSGAVDTAFAAAGGHTATVEDFAMLPDGRVMLAGDYGTFQSSPTGPGPIWRFFSGLASAPGAVQFTAAGYSGTEGGTAQLTVSRSGAGVGALTVGYSTVAGTASTSDFTTTSGVLTWADGDLVAKTVSVPLTTDALTEVAETFIVNLGQPLVGGALLGTVQQAVVQVNDPVLLTGFEIWQQAKFTAGELLDANISGPSADPDGDGFGNLVEYALGLEPKSASTTGLPEVTSDATHWIYTYTRPTGTTDVTYAVEFSTNLTTWGAPGVAAVLVGTVNDVETWQAKQLLGSASNAYFRLKVTGQ